MPNIPYKPITSRISTRQEEANLKTISSSGLTYTLCDRTELNTREANYFISFKVPYNSDQLSTGSTLSTQNPELQQLNVDKMVISPIPRDEYNEIIDGRSVTFTVPQVSGATSMSAKTVVSSTYSQLSKSQDSILLGNNIAFLFSDDINLPRTGTTMGGNPSVNAINTRSTWEVTPFVNRPQAHAYSDLEAVDINTDTRPWSGVDLSVYVEETYPTNTNAGYNYDIPVGFAVLDKGFMVLTHPDIVDNIPWNEGYKLHSNDSNSGISSGTTDIYFTASTNSSLTYSDIRINFRTSVVCLALPTEFVFSTNPSWDLDFNIQELSNGTNGFDPVQITEVGLYNIKDELIAVAKMSEPVEKNFTNLLTFNLDIDV